MRAGVSVIGVLLLISACSSGDGGSDAGGPLSAAEIEACAELAADMRLSGGFMSVVIARSLGSPHIPGNEIPSHVRSLDPAQRANMFQSYLRDRISVTGDEFVEMFEDAEAAAQDHDDFTEWLRGVNEAFLLLLEARDPNSVAILCSETRAYVAELSNSGIVDGADENDLGLVWCATSQPEIVTTARYLRVELAGSDYEGWIAGSPEEFALACSAAYATRDR